MAAQDNVEPLVVLQPISVDTRSPDQTGMLVLVNGLLVAVLVRLDAPEHERPGAWFMEVGLGRLAGVRAPTFDTLEEATRWMRRRVRGYAC
ncbi:hypothetical protein MKK63_17970 [Methylobacterium sp. J-088]|uniref:hypothetical protein n=1 Tax=unclassified Methylobacterium TaxID=2615210 RepID=UPI001FB9BFB9|nr:MULTISPECIES: hypothetical protein [unclassified Methylobacterium]MCJ2019501.1 hypothetical protein [Methylobacterium sp. E-065]MCJ2064587.1 hypothetical protein [Methylobacterium sp. J-088]